MQPFAGPSLCNHVCLAKKCVAKIFRRKVSRAPLLATGYSFAALEDLVLWTESGLGPASHPFDVVGSIAEVVCKREDHIQEVLPLLVLWAAAAWEEQDSGSTVTKAPRKCQKDARRKQMSSCDCKCHP